MIGVELQDGRYVITLPKLVLVLDKASFVAALKAGKALKRHQALAELFPLMTGPDLAALAADIKAHGPREPIWLYQGKILDGRNRYGICQTLGIPCPTREYTGDDPVGFVLSMNLHRRHLNESQRALVAAKLATSPPRSAGQQLCKFAEFQPR